MRAIVQSWRTFWALKSAERDIVREAAIGLTATWVGLRAFGFRRWNEIVVRRVGRATEIGSARRLVALSANRILQLEAAAARNLFFHTNCLEQSLVLWSILRRHGFAAELKIGARKEAGRFEAHAWVELDGHKLNDAGDSHAAFAPFDGAISSMETQVE
jgi:transglutaminase superfamily protein